MADQDARDITKILATIAIGVLVLGPIFSMGIGLSGSSVQIAPVDNPNPVLESGDIPSWVGVEASTGITARYTEDGGHTSFSAPLNTSDTYTATVVVELNESADTNATYTLLGYNNGEFALHYDDGQYLAHVEADNKSATATLPAPNPRQPAVVGLHYNATSAELQVIRETTRSAPAQLSNATATEPVSFTLDGSLDELRLVQGNLSSSQLSRVSSTPAASLPGADRVARIMWDEDSSSVPVYFTGSSATVTGATYTDGVQDPGLAQGSDYDLSGNPFTVHVLDGGLIEDAPVAYVSWNGPFGTFIQSIQGLASTALGLLAISTIAIAGRRALSAF